LNKAKARALEKTHERHENGASTPFIAKSSRTHRTHISFGSVERAPREVRYAECVRLRFFCESYVRDCARGLNRLMGMARRTIGKDDLMLRAMVSGECMTVGTLI
jgi:hypothetical protein